MKKLLLILTVVFVSVTSVFADNDANDPYTLNPYAYDLKSTWDPNTEKLSLSFKLNSIPNLSTANGNDIGIQVVAEDEDGNKYILWEVSESTIKSAHNKGGGSYSVVLNISDRLDAKNKPFPTNKIFRWKVRVAGRKAVSADMDPGTGATINYSKARYWDASNHDFGKKRFVTSSIAINTNPQSPNFGRIIIAEGIKVSGDNTTTWGDVHSSTYYASTEGRGVYILEPDFVSYANGGKRAALNTTIIKGGFVDPFEPKEIRVTESGRIFLSSFSQNSNVAIWELSSNYKVFTEVLTKTDIGTRRVIAMDVKEVDGNVMLLLLCTPKNASTPFSCHEYNLGTNELKQINLPNVISNHSYYLQQINAQAKIAYGEGNTLWFSFGTSSGSDVISMDRTNQTVYENEHFGASYGGEGFLVKGDFLAKSYRSTSTLYLNAGVYFKKIINGNAIDGDFYADNFFISEDRPIGCGHWINDFAIDYANNLFVAGSWHGRVFPISLPYDGIRETPAPDGMTFTFADPVPNILATDLCCTPHETKPKYIFSFNVNTKPEGAEIRFYTTEADMLADCNKNESYDRYDDHSKCQYYYRFEDGELKQGRMSVELDILGHEGGKELADKKLPAGKLYWNVYLKTRESLAFAPIYVQPIEGDDLHYRLHATIDNNPDNDGFGHIYAVDYKKDKTDSDMKNNPCWLMVYSIGENITNNSNRYSKIQHLTANDMVQPRRPAVAPDGMVYLTDYGDYRYSEFSTNLSTLTSRAFQMGGIWLFDPSLAANKANTGAATLSRFYLNNASETTSDVCFLETVNGLKLYKTNTYEEFSHHGSTKGDANNYQAEKWMNNGYRIYTMERNQDGTLKHQMSLESSASVIPFKVKDGDGKWVGGDANGSISVRATSDGVWFCQNRKGTVAASISADQPYPDARESVALMFYNNSGERKFQSYTYDGGSLTQFTTSILQSTPGAGMTISPDENYLYVVNHDGDILEFKIGGSATSGKNLTLKNKFINTTTYKGISTMNFDYAGNLVVITDQDYPADASQKTQIVVFTMPYNRDNARSIPASKAQREIPERLAYNDEKINTETTIAKKPALVDLYRPMPNTSYSTICLPFDLNLVNLADGHPYKLADVRAFESATISEVGGEKMLFLNFSAAPVTTLSANTPYIIKPQVRIPGVVEFSTTTWGTNNDEISQTRNFGNSNYITFTGVIPKQDIVVQEGKTLLLVAENRLAEMEPDDNATNMGEILGFRGYFTLGAPLPKGMQAILRNKDNTVTGLVDINGKKVNIEKYLREGRVYIRVGDTLYTITGEKVK